MREREANVHNHKIVIETKQTSLWQILIEKDLDTSAERFSKACFDVPSLLNLCPENIL